MSKSIDEYSRRYGIPSVVSLSQAGAAASAELSEIYTDEEMRKVNKDSSMIRSIPQASPLNGEAMSAKLKDNFDELLSLTPASIITSDGVVTTGKPVPWELDSSYGNMRTSFFGSQNAPGNGLGLPGTGFVTTTEHAGTVTTIEFEDDYVSAIDDAVFWFEYRQEDNEYAYRTFPPKLGCYNWSAVINFDITLDTGAATWLEILLGTRYPILEAHVKTLGGATTHIIKKTLDVNINGSTADFTSTFLIPFDGALTGVDFVLKSDEVVAVEMIMNIDSVKLVGLPLNDECPLDEVDYLIQGRRYYLNGSEDWQKFFGHVDEDHARDPNWSLEAIWYDRVHGEEVRLAEIVRSISSYVRYYWGNDPGAPRIDDKYAIIKPGLAFQSLSKSNRWIYRNGPLGGTTQANANKLLLMMFGDIDTAKLAIDSDEEFASHMATHNATMCSTLCSY